jgi:ELWxxDGT repeat protein
MFAGDDTSGNDGLWVSNGTAAGTYELTGIAGASATAFDPFNFVNYNGEVLFEGTDSGGNLGLWVTNGTALGTTEITAVGNPNISFLDAANALNIAVVNGRAGKLALFNAQDSSGNYGLWVTNGTAAGTQELTAISGASASGLDPLWLTALGGEVLFDGVDASGEWGLWVTNGAAAGTVELTGIAGASTGKDNVNGGPANIYGLAPHSFAAFNGEVLFAGFDSSGNNALWVTNGTAAGTRELSASAISPQGFAVLNGEALFVAKDSSGDRGLWVTNGTAAGTHELTGISGAASAANGGLDVSDLTAFNGEVLFNGQDSNGSYGLWVTNGTADGTYELTGITGADPLAFGASNFTVIGGGVEFTGTYAFSGNFVVTGPGLWVTNGAAADTHRLAPISGAAPDVLPIYYTNCEEFVGYKGELLFTGVDSNGYYSLWETNGTAAGTQEITGVAGTYTGFNQGIFGASGLDPYGLTVCNGQIVFGGWDTNGNAGLWVTDGTAAGTHELTGITGAAASIDPYWFTALKGNVMFNGVDASGQAGLWITNGTAAGTYEIASGNGLNPGYLATCNGEVLFSGSADSDGGLWVSNGTSAGTYELTGISGANPYAFEPIGFTALNSEVLFSAQDDAGYIGLWVTNGTGAGTYEVTGIAGASTSGFSPNGFTVLNGEALFNATDSSGNEGLWVTNGTAAGTYELAGITGASAGKDTGYGGTGLDPTDLTVYNGEVLFMGYDSGGNTGLWVTDGTAAGTYELTGVAGVSGTNSDGTTGLDASGLTVYDGKVLFTNGGGVGPISWGETGTGSGQGLWVTDGTAAGTYEAAGTSGLQPSSLTAVIVGSYTPPDNFTGGSTSDILGWNTSTGVVGDFVMNNGVAGAFQDIAWINPASGYQVAGSGDFYGTGTADILLANSSGQIGEFAMSNNAATWQGLGLINSGAGWAVAGTGDFYGNGTDDILLANQSAGQIGEFEMNNGVATWQGIGTVNAAAGWAVAGTGDFFGNGTDDILLANQTAGQIGMFEMNNGVASWQGIGTVNAAAGWTVAGTGDFVGNGTDDILLANSQTGQLGMFAMNNGAASWQSIGTVGAGWQVAGTGDYFGNGTSDILLQNASTGGIGMFAMNNGVASWQGISSLPTGWKVS